jgi:hypothetical protein
MTVIHEMFNAALRQTALRSLELESLGCFIQSYVPTIL